MQSPTDLSGHRLARSSSIMSQGAKSKCENTHRLLNYSSATKGTMLDLEGAKLIFELARQPVTKAPSAVMFGKMAACGFRLRSSSYGGQVASNPLDETPSGLRVTCRPARIYRSPLGAARIARLPARLKQEFGTISAPWAW